MAKVKITAAVTLQEQLAADIYDMRIKAPEIAESAVPGQFVSLYSKRRGQDSSASHQFVRH